MYIHLSPMHTIQIKAVEQGLSPAPARIRPSRPESGWRRRHDYARESPASGSLAAARG